MPYGPSLKSGDLIYIFQCFVKKDQLSPLKEHWRRLCLEPGPPSLGMGAGPWLLRDEASWVGL